MGRSSGFQQDRPRRADADDLGLGRLRLEREAPRESRTVGWGLFLGGFAGSVMAAVFVFLVVADKGLGDQDAGPYVVFGAFAVAILGAQVYGAWLLLRPFPRGRLCIYEHGLALEGPEGVRALRFDEVGEMIWGRPIVFVPRLEVGRRSIVFGGNPLDPELVRFRDSLAEQIAEEMLARLEAGQPVAWTANLRFLPEGLEYRPREFLGRVAPLALDYEGLRYTTTGLEFSLYLPGCTAPCFTERADARNFHAGLVLLERFLARREMEEARRIDRARAILEDTDEQGSRRADPPS